MRKSLRVCAGVFMVALCTMAGGQTQSDLNRESYLAFQKADKSLNAAYQKLLAKLDKEGQQKLREAERLWVKFRDAECEAQADDYRGGSIVPLIYNSCAERLTQRRTDDLQMRLDELDR